MSDEAHSERYFTDSRDHWWHLDTLELLCRRTSIPAAPRVLEVGSGQGHFARAFAQALPAGFHYTCLEPEARSTEIARTRTEAWRADASVQGDFEFVVGRGEALPFADESFDVVVCQTVLIHVPEPARVFGEMVRVARRGGLVIAIEPNNLASLQHTALYQPSGNLELALAETRFMWTVSRGKGLLGEGNNNFGVELPALFRGLSEVRMWSNDRVWSLAPPYDSAVARLWAADVRRDDAQGVFGWPRSQARRYYLAGGGSAPAFEADYDALLAMQRHELAEVEAGRHVELVGFSGFIATGRRPR